MNKQTPWYDQQWEDIPTERAGGYSSRFYQTENIAVVIEPDYGYTLTQYRAMEIGKSLTEHLGVYTTYTGVAQVIPRIAGVVHVYQVFQ
jgi:hypothetical protein